MTNPRDKMTKNTKYMIQYVHDVTIAPNTDPKNMAMKCFDSWLSLIWFILRDNEVQRSIVANRFQQFNIKKDKQSAPAAS